MVVVVVVYRCPPSFLLMVSVVVGGRGGLRVGALHGCYARVGGGRIASERLAAWPTIYPLVLLLVGSARS